MRAYGQALRSYRSRFTPSAPEVIFEINDPTIPSPFRFFRADLGSGAVSPPNITKVDIGCPPRRPPQTFRLPYGLSLTLQPIAWNAVDFVTTPFDADASEFISWCSRWLDIGEKRKPDRNGFAHVIHAVTPPTREERRCTFTVDFGSASVEA